MNTIGRVVASFKALARMRWGRTASLMWSLLGSTHFDYRSSAGDGRSNAAVMACVRFVQRALPEAPLRVYTVNRAGEHEPAPTHALQAVLDAPNPFYSGLHLIGAIAADLMLTGNAYVVKVRSGNGRAAQLWWVPSALMEPIWPDNDPTVYISHYEYRVEGQVIDIPPRDVVHVRQGFDPQNIRKGLSDLAALYREVATDNEAANWTASLLRNGAVPGVVISPEGETLATDEDLLSIKDKFTASFGGDQRGAPLVTRGPTRIQMLSFSPDQMNLSALRSVPEERITAVFGIPAAVVGLGTGLEQTKVGATMREMREQAYESCLIPLQRLIASELMLQLVPDFGDVSRLRVMFDLSDVRVLQDDQNALHERARADLAGGLLTLNQALTMIGMDPVDGPEGDVRFVPSTVTVTPPERLIPPEPQEMLPPGDGELPMDEDDEEAGQPRALAAAGRRNGQAKEAAFSLNPGPPAVLSDDDLDRLAEVGPIDLDAAERFWRRAVEDTGLGDLFTAQPEDDD